METPEKRRERRGGQDKGEMTEGEKIKTEGEKIKTEGEGRMDRQTEGGRT